MKAQISKTNLALATSRVQGALLEKSYAHIAIKGTDDGKLTLAANDSILAAYCTTESDVQEKGVVFVPAKLFSDIVREVPEGPVNLMTEDSHLKVTGGTREEFTIKIPLLEDLSWREPHVFVSNNHSKLPTSKISYMIEQVQFCVAQESSRNYGVVGYLHRSEQGMRLVGSDGFRLSYCDIKMDLNQDFLGGGICISKRGLNELLRMCHEGVEEIDFLISEDQTTLLVSIPDYKLFIRLSAIKFPNYTSVLPKETQTKVEVARPHIQSVAKRVLLASDKNKSLQLCFSESGLRLKSRNAGASEGFEDIFLQGFSGKDQTISVNGKYLNDVFSSTTSEKLKLQFRTDDEPIMIVPDQEPQDCQSVHVIVPIKEISQQTEQQG